MPRRLLATLLSLPLLASAQPAFAGQSAVPTSHAGVVTVPVTAVQLAPPACAGLPLATVVTVGTTDTAAGNGGPNGGGTGRPGGGNGGGGATTTTIRGTNGSDLVLGTPGDDVLDGRRGDDCLVGGGGDDTVDGGQDTDVCLPGTDPGDTVTRCEDVS